MGQNCQFYIVIAVLNARETLERCLMSVLSQEYPHYKLLVVDGGSDDGTVEILQKYQADLSWWVSGPDTGIYDAWNKALHQIKDGWALFLGADDVLQSPDVLLRVADSLQHVGSGIKVAYGQIAVVSCQGHIYAIKGQPWALAGKNFTSIMTLPHQGVFHHSSLFKEYGGFNPELKIAGDYDLLLKVLLDYPPLYLDDLIVASWQIGGISYDVKTPILVAREFSQVRRNNGYHALSFPLFVFYIKAYVLRGLYLLFGDRFSTRVASIYRKVTGQWI
ncbi:MAG: glycosyltransferase [Geopsychrobacter sp.]|nr:glycosyltransferase [Geopsychrobacter sp.]